MQRRVHPNQCFVSNSYSNPSSRLCSSPRRPQLGAKHPVPEATGDAESILIVGKMVLQMILFQFPVIVWQSNDS